MIKKSIAIFITVFLALQLQACQNHVNESYDEIKSMIDVQSKEIESLKAQIDLLKSNRGEAFKNYMTLYAYDAIKEMKGYSHATGNIKSFNKKNQSIELDLVELVNYSDEKRIKELNIDTSKNPISGFYIYDGAHETAVYALSENLKTYVYDFEGTGELTEINLEFLSIDLINAKPLFRFEMIDGKIFRITQVFLN